MLKLALTFPEFRPAALWLRRLLQAVLATAAGRSIVRDFAVM